MYQVQYGSRYKKSLRKNVKTKNFPIDELESVITTLAPDKIIDSRYGDHYE